MLMIIAKNADTLTLPAWSPWIIGAVTVLATAIAAHQWYKARRKEADDKAIEKANLNNKIESIESDIYALKKKDLTKTDYSSRLTVLETQMSDIKKRFDQSDAQQSEMLKLLHEIIGKVNK